MESLTDIHREPYGDGGTSSVVVCDACTPCSLSTLSTFPSYTPSLDHVCPFTEILLFVYLEKQRNKERERTHWLTSQMSTKAKNGVGQAETRNQEYNPNLPLGLQEPSYLSHPHYLPGSALAGSWHC